MAVLTTVAALAVPRCSAVSSLPSCAQEQLIDGGCCCCCCCCCGRVDDGDDVGDRRRLTALVQRTAYTHKPDPGSSVFVRTR
uniref:Putative secreted protein n=1 Tax=Anopheles darlingi TaxID=43151 RepID=A0A2M4D7W1_ANODA